MPDTPSNSSRFTVCLAKILAEEGGYTDNPLDPGGATNFGITRRTLAAWRTISPWQNLPKSAVKALTKTEATAIYRARYWDRCNADALPVGLDLALFDFAVNSGPQTAIEALQNAVGAKPDGRVGPQTLAAIAAYSAKNGVGGLIVTLSDRRLNFLHRLLAFSRFGIGWSRRVATIRAAALVLAGAAAPAPSAVAAAGSVLFSNLQGVLLMFNLLSGYKTYIVGAAMLVFGLANLLGVALPAFDGQSGADLLMQGLGIIFLRHGIATATTPKS